MALLKILTYPNSKLRKTSAKCRPQVNLSELNKLIDKMFEAMKFYNGCGLSGIQVGIALRVIVLDVEGQKYAMLNPKILQKEGICESLEGCLSIPHAQGYVQRFDKIEVEYLDREGKEQKLIAQGLLSSCIQHEIDHCDGILFIDHLSHLKKDMIMKRLKKIGKLTVRG